MVKNLSANVGDMGPIPGSGRSPGEGSGNSLQHSRLRNPMVRGDRQATVHGVTKSQIQLSIHTRTHTHTHTHTFHKVHKLKQHIWKNYMY